MASSAAPRSVVRPSGSATRREGAGGRPFRRHHASEAIAEEGGADAIVRMRRGQSEHRRHLGRKLRPGAPPTSYLGRRALIHQQEDGEFALFVMPAQVGDAESRRDAPVDGADVVTRLVLTYVLELDAAAAEGARVVAGREVAHQPARREFESPHLFGDLVRDHGTAICPRIRSTIWSVVTLSASAR
jgi:hypothetical protein